MMKKAKPINPKKTHSTCDEFVNALSQKKRIAFEEEYKDFVLSELVLAIMAQDEISVRELAKVAGLSPTVVQAMRSGQKKTLV